MKIIEQSVELAQDLNPAEIMKQIERVGRVCYKSESKISVFKLFGKMARACSGRAPFSRIDKYKCSKSAFA